MDALGATTSWSASTTGRVPTTVKMSPTKVTSRAASTTTDTPLTVRTPGTVADISVAPAVRGTGAASTNTASGCRSTWRTSKTFPSR